MIKRLEPFDFEIPEITTEKTQLTCLKNHVLKKIGTDLRRFKCSLCNAEFNYTNGSFEC